MDTATGVWETPGGHRALMSYRPGTNDWNVISSIMAPHDEYAIPGGALSGWAADIGSHVGGVAIAVALDNPEVRVLAVEPVPQNVELLKRNVEQNGLTDRIVVIPGAIGLRGNVTVWYGYRGSESLEHHAWIGNSSLAYDHGGEISHDSTEYPATSLADLVAMADGFLAWCKIDCEGGEWDALRSQGVQRIGYITGEFHPTRGHVRSDLVPLLDATHDLTFPDPPKGVDPEIGPGPFIAVLR